jgi:xylulokinase
VITLGIDLGTGSVKVAAVDSAGTVLAQAKRPYLVTSPQPGWAETEPSAWLAATQQAADEVLAAVGRSIDAVGFSGQMHGVVLTDEQGHAIRPAILWADSRSTAEVADLAQQFSAQQLARLGSPAVPGFAATTLAWLHRNERATLAQARYALQPKDWLRLNLGGAVATDPSDATGTLLCDVEEQQWSDEVLTWAGIAGDLLPPIIGSNDAAGSVRLGGAEFPAVVGGSDTACAMAGIGMVRGGGFIAVGTGSQIGRVIDAASPDLSLVTHTFADVGPVRSGWYRLGGVQNAGLSLETALRVLSATTAEAAAALAQGVRADDPIYIPYVAGERTPFMDGQLRGGWLGIGLATDRAAMLRSVMEGVAHAVDLGVQAVVASGCAMPATIPLVGGGTHDPAFQQLLADATGSALGIVDAPDAAVIGAAMLAQGRTRLPTTAALQSIIEPRTQQHHLLRERQRRIVTAVHDQQRERA